MKTKNFFMKMSDGFEVWVNRWEPDNVEDIKGIIQLHHGLSEHSMRYDRFGSILAENGYVLNAYDMRGHGKTAEHSIENKTGLMGKLADKNGYLRVLTDLDEMIESIKSEYPDKPVLLFAHSFGSFIGQLYIENFSNKIDGCILCGTSGPKGPVIAFGKLVAALYCLFRGKNTVSPSIYNAVFGLYNRKISNPQSEIDWVAASPSAVKMYENDKWCGTPLTNSFYTDMFNCVGQIQQKKNMAKIRKDLPLMIIYGSDDPVGDYGKSIKKLESLYRKLGISNIKVIEYAGLRHEILNEDSKETVENDVLGWINNTLTK